LKASYLLSSKRFAKGRLSLYPATVKFPVSARRAADSHRVINDPGFKMVEREGRLRLWVKRGDLTVVYVIPDVVFFLR
jgi:hypothetical protein